MSLAYNSGSQTATVTEENGAQISFTQFVSGSSPAWCNAAVNFCSTAPRIDATLNQNNDGSWTFKRMKGGQTTLTFSSAGQLISIADAAGDTLTSGPYTAGSSQTACPAGDSCNAWTSSASGKELVLATDANSRLVSVFDANSSLAANFNYSGSGCSAWSAGEPLDLCNVTDPGGHLYAYTYDSANATSNFDYDMLTEKSPTDSGATANVYDTAGRIVQQTDPTGAVATLSYSGTNSSLTGGTTTVTSYPLGAGPGEPQQVTVYMYSSDVLVQRTVGAGTSSQTNIVFNRDPVSLLPLTVQDGDGNVSSTSYQTYSGSGGNSVSSANALTTTDGAGNTVQHAYNALNQTWCDVDAADYANGVRCPANPPASPPAPGASDPNLGATISFYDSADHLVAQTDPLDNTTTHSYTSAISGVPNGLMYCSVDPVDYKNSITCPAYGAASVRGATSTTFDSFGNVLTSTDALGDTTDYCYYYQTSTCAASAPAGGSGGNPQRLYSTIDPESVAASSVNGTPSVTFYTYDAAGDVLTEVVSAKGYQTTALNAYTPGGLLYCTITQLAYSQGHTSCPTPPPSIPPASGSDLWPGATITIYDNAGRALYTINPLGGVTQHAYDNAGEQYCAIDATAYAKGVTCPSTPPASPPAIGSDPYLGATITTYDPAGRIVQVTSPLGGITLTGYDPAGNVSQTTVESNNSTASPNVVTGYTYDGDNRVTSATTDPGTGLAATTASFYDPNGNTYCRVSANAEAQGSSAFQCPVWQTTWISAPPNPNSLYSTTPNSGQANNVTTSFFNADGQQLQTTNPNLETTIAAVDRDSRTYCSADPTNVAGWLTTHPTGNYPYLCPAAPPSSAPAQGSNPGYITNIYDAAGHLESKTDQLGDTTSYTYDLDGQVESTTDPRGEVTSYCHYGENGVIFYPPLGDVYECAYFAPAGGVATDIYEVSTEKAMTTYTYYPGGKPNLTTTAAGTATNSYDAEGDLTSASYSGTAVGYVAPTSLSYSYNADSSPSTVTDATGTTTYSYDNSGDLTSKTLSARVGSGLSNTTTSYSYYTSGVLASIAYPSYTGHTNPTVTYAYDGTGAMTAATDWLGNQVTFAHDPAGNQTAQDNNVSTTSPNGTSSTSFNYDNAGFNSSAVATLAQTCGGNETLTQTFSGSGGSRNPDGQLTQYQTSYSGSCSGQTGYQRNYSYDLAERVVYQGSTLQGANPNDFAYDPSGDPTTISSHDSSGNFDTYTQTFDNAAETLSQTPISGSHGSSSTYTYDTVGDQTSVTTGASTTYYGFDQTGHMLTATSPSGSGSAYLYDQNGLEAARGQITTWALPTVVDSTRSIKSVSCAANTFCAAIDASGYTTTFNGTTWSTPTNSDGTHALDAVSCVASSFCKAVDNAGNVLSFNGTSWSSGVSIDSRRTINSISCASTSFCAAVDGSGYAITYNGTAWSSPSHIDGSHSLNSVSCTGSSFCQAVDNAGNVLTYNGSSWSTATSIDSTRALNSISCPTMSFCAAVDASGYTTTFNGTTWSTPTNIDNTHALNSISCSISTFCETVDNAGNGLTYNGVSWLAAASIDSTRVINSVSCPSTSFCAAVDASGYVVNYRPTTSITQQLTWNTSSSLPLLLSDGNNHYIYGPSGTPVEQVNLVSSIPTYLTYTPSDDSWLSANEAGDQTGFWGYDAYGTLSFGAPTSPFGYSGQYTDATTALVNDRARWYEPQTGGFTTSDPAFASTDQAYAYVGGDPVNNTDPSGLAPISPWCEAHPDICARYTTPGWISGIGGALNSALGIIEGLLPWSPPSRPSPSSWCKPSNPPYGETFYGTDGCIAYQTSPATGTTAIGVVMAPWTPPDGVFDYVVGVDGRVVNTKWNQMKWPTLHDSLPSSIAPPGSLVEVLAEYITPTIVYTNVPNAYVVPDLSGITVVGCLPEPSSAVLLV